MLLLPRKNGLTSLVEQESSEGRLGRWIRGGRWICVWGAPQKRRFNDHGQVAAGAIVVVVVVVVVVAAVVVVVVAFSAL